MDDNIDNNIDSNQDINQNTNPDSNTDSNKKDTIQQKKKTKAALKREEQENLIQVNQDLIDKIITDIKEPIKIFKNYTSVNIPKYKDEVIIGLMLHLKLIKEYKCHSTGCSVKKCWKKQPIQLLLNRKNNKKYDLKKDNLELICPNCYLQYYGHQKLLEKLEGLIYKCAICQYPLNNGKNKGNTNKYCFVCSKKISQQAETEFENSYAKKIMSISGQSVNSKFKYENNSTERTDYGVNYSSSHRNNIEFKSKSNKTEVKLNMNLNLDLNEYVENIINNDN